MNSDKNLKEPKDPHSREILRKLRAMTDEELNAIFDSSPSYQRKMEEDIEALKAVKNLHGLKR